MNTYNEGKGLCDNCWLAIYAPNGGYICMEQTNKSLFEMPGCPGAITDKIVRKAQAAAAAAFKRRWEEIDHLKQEQLAKTKAELDQLLSEAKLLVLQLKSAKLQMEDKQQKKTTLGTVAELSDPPPASEFPPKTGKVKIKVKIAMNIDLIAEYFCWAAQLREEEWYLDGEPAGLSRIRAERKANELREKKSSLEAKIMEKLMA